MSKDGGPAFGVEPEYAECKRCGSAEVEFHPYRGLTKREWFAGMALAGLMTARPGFTSYEADGMAFEAYAAADAMIRLARGDND